MLRTGGSLQKRPELAVKLDVVVYYKDQRTNPQYGKGTHTLEGDIPWTQEAVVERLGAAFDSPDYRPPVLPSVAIQLLQLARRLDVQLREVLQLLEQDTLIAGAVLKLAQSPLYQRGGAIRSLDQAVTRLGFRTLSDLCLEASMNARVFRAPGYEKSMNDLRRHSAATAQVARQVSTIVAFPDDYAYTCGLMHDAGMAACLAVLGEVPRGKTRPPLDLVGSAVRDVHEAASAILAAAWKLPPDVQLVMGRHHHPFMDGRIHPLIASISLAEALATEAGAPAGMDTPYETSEAAAQPLSVSESQLDRLRSFASHVVSELD